MALKIGSINRLRVERRTDIAYILKNNDDEEVFLHVNESGSEALIEDSYVDAFLYYDAKGRLAATLKKPLITAGHPGLLEVVSFHPPLGVFMKLGINKDLLLSRDELGNNQSMWPIVGDKLMVDIRVTTQLTARPLKVEEFEVKTTGLEIGAKQTGFIQAITDVGYFIYTETMHLILVKKVNTRKQYRLGECVDVTVSYLTARGYEGSLVDTKEIVRVDDAKQIVDYLKVHGNEMPYTADTESDVVMHVFGLSRKAFKRALGLLYRQRKITFKDGKTVMVNENE